MLPNTLEPFGSVCATGIWTGMGFVVAVDHHAALNMGPPMALVGA